jgi:hypothetical protein
VSKKLDAFAFVEGRDAYVKKLPMLEVLHRIDEIDAEGVEDKAECFLLGFLDGVISDIRDSAQNAREEMAERRLPPDVPL